MPNRSIDRRQLVRDRTWPRGKLSSISFCSAAMMVVRCPLRCDLNSHSHQGNNNKQITWWISRVALTGRAPAHARYLRRHHESAGDYYRYVYVSVWSSFQKIAHMNASRRSRAHAPRRRPDRTAGSLSSDNAFFSASIFFVWEKRKACIWVWCKTVD